jgi:short-subunit dehydrogenase
MRPMELSGRRVLITGATGGIGNAIARALHARGAHVIVSGRRGAVLDELRASLGDRVEVVEADLSRPEDVDALMERVAPLDVLVANAALPASGRLVTFAPDEIERALEVNLHVPIRMARDLVPQMLERGSGHLVFVSSMSGKIASGGGTVYSATKFGLRGFAEALRDELHGTGVGVTVVYPGFIRDAGMFAEAAVELPRYAGTRSPEQVAEGVISGIEKNRGTVEVAPLSVRASGLLAAAAPGAVAAFARRLGAAEVAEKLAEGQRDKR